MADRTQLRVADNNAIAEDDPFAELTRIMGFDPRQPARPHAPAEKAAPAQQAADEADFDIDLEKELMGEFDVAEQSAPIAHQPAANQVADEPTFEAVDAAGDDELAASFEQDFVFDDAADHAHFAATRAPEPVADVALDDDFDKAVANALEISPIEDDLSVDQEMASSLDEDFQLEHRELDAGHRAPEVAEFVAPVVEAVSDADFDDAVGMSLEDELAFDGPQYHPAPVEARQAGTHLAEDQLISDDDFAGHFDEALADVDPDRPQEIAHNLSLDDDLAASLEAPAEVAHFAAETAPALEAGEQGFDDDFELSFREALDEQQVPVVEPVAARAPFFADPSAAVPTPAAAVEPAKPAAAERSLEDELNALLGAMTARAMPVAPAPSAPIPVAPASVLKEPAPAPQSVIQLANYTGQKAPAADNLDWDLDEREPTRNEQGARPASEADLNALLAGELQQDGFEDVFEQNAEPGLDFDDEAFDAAFARGIEAHQGASVTDEPARSWSRVTPVAAPAQASFAAQPMPSAPQMAAPARRDEPARDYSAYVQPAAPAPQPRHHDEMPDVETVDVPERVVALADDLDIPELSFEDDQPSAPAYDDFDAEFASLLTEMNATEIASAPVQPRAYDDDSYNAGFKTGYDRRDLRPETPAAPAAASQAVANDFDADDLPGSRPVSRADDFAVEELDYDPELDEAMTVPGLAEREAAKPRSRGMMVAALVGAVAIAGGLGALAFSFGGKGGSEAPVIVKADNSPIKVKPENPGGTVVPNQDNRVYDAVVKGGSAKPAEPVQQKLVTNTEEPVDVASKEPPQSRVVDLSPDDTDAAPGTDAAGNPDAAAPGSAQAAAPAPKSEDRIAQVLQEADQGTNTDVVAVAPRKVKTMMVKPDGSLVPREDPAPAAPQVAAAEPTDPAPQHVAPTGQSDAQPTGTVAPAADQAAGQASDDQAAKPAKPAAAKAEAKAQSSNTPAKVPVAPPRPSDQPVDIVGEVKPDQVASIDPSASAGGGSWSMQIASQPTVESAQSTYQDLQRRYGSVLSGRTANIVKAEVAGKGTFYRVRVPAQSRNDAINLCTSYKAAGGNCFVSR